MLEKYKSEFIFFGFVAIWLALSFYNRISLDDWCLSVFVTDVSYTEFMNDFWRNYEGAFSSVTANFVVFRILNQWQFFGVIFNVSALVLFLGSIIFFMKRLSTQIQAHFSKIFLTSFSLLLFFSLYVFQPQHKGVFFNYNWSICYFLPISIFIFSLALLFDASFIKTAGAIVLFFILGAWKFHYSLIFIFILGSLYLFGMHIRENTGLRRRIIYSIISILVTLSIYISAPGNFARLARMNKSGQQGTLLQNLLNIKLVDWYLFYKNIIFHPGNFALIILLILFFCSLKKDLSNRANIFILENYGRIFIWSTGWILVLTFGNGLFFAAVAGSLTYVTRVYVLMYFLIALYVIFMAYLISLKIEMRFIAGNRYILFAAVVTIFGYFLLKIPKAVRYADAFDKRESTIKEEMRNNRITNLYVRTLPESGVFETGEFAAEGEKNMSFINDCAREYYQTKFNIYQIEKINYE